MQMMARTFSLRKLWGRLISRRFCSVTLCVLSVKPSWEHSRWNLSSMVEAKWDCVRNALVSIAISPL